MNPWSFFERRVVLTADDVQWTMAQEEFVRVGITEYEKFQALPLDDKEILGPHQSFSGSCRQILRDFLASESNTLLMLEEDCIFRDTSHVERALSELPNDWDVFYLGANLILQNGFGECHPKRYSDHLFRIDAAWTTHAIGYNKKCVSEILAKQPGLSVQMYDQYLSSRLPEFNAYIIAPMLAYQRPHFTGIWKEADGSPKWTDYTDVFEASEEKLK